MTLKEAKKVFIIGDKIKCRLPFFDGGIGLVHIVAIIPSKCYHNKTFIHYKVYGKHRQWWHEFFEVAEDLQSKIDRKI